LANVILSVNNLSKKHTDDFGLTSQLFEELNFSMDESLLTTILAPMGSGKSSLLKILAGFDKSYSGEINSTGEKVAYLHNEPNSFPWLSVKENVAFGNTTLSADKISDAIKFCGLEGYEDHHPNNKSIGFRFRISLARVLANDFELILIDEHFSKVDSGYKIELYNLVHQLITERNIAVLLATSNISEAVYLSDKIIVMTKNPCTIIHELNIDRSNLSKRNSLTNEELLKYKKEIEDKIHDSKQDKFFTYNV